jgi:AmmeMemoRadiSam system protein A
MKEECLSSEDRQTLLKIAREALIHGVKENRLRPIDLGKYPNTLKEFGASFVTLTKDGLLRGCIGSLEPHQPLCEDVREHVVAAATQDFRFPPVSEDELGSIKIEISRLSKPQPLSFEDPDDLISKLRPGIDGVVINYGGRRATFLPQVWVKIKEPKEFLNHLCLKMSLPAETWRTKEVDVFTYQVEEFHE